MKRLFRYTGSKSGKQYQFLSPTDKHTHICEPFMGSAARSIQSPGAAPILGETNPTIREIALSNQTQESKDRFIRQFNTIRFMLFDGIDIGNPDYHGFQSIKEFRKQHPWECEIITERWDILRTELFHNPNPGMMMVFLLLGARPSLRQGRGKYNTPWHSEKIKPTVKFNPRTWQDELDQVGWNPIVTPDCYSAMRAVPNPESCYLLLDPPYATNPERCKINKTYSNQPQDEQAIQLAISSLSCALELGFKHIDLCNYEHPILDDCVDRLVLEYGLSCSAVLMGNLGAFHPERSINPQIEKIWQIRPRAF